MAKKNIRQKPPKSRFSTKTPQAKSTEQLPPIFSLQHMRTSHCVSCCEQQEKAHFADTLRKLSQVTWAELKQVNRHSLGYEKISRDSLKVGIPSNIKEDAKFISFRFDGMKAMIGYRTGRIFYIIWLDRNFSVYNHN